MKPVLCDTSEIKTLKKAREFAFEIDTYRAALDRRIEELVKDTGYLAEWIPKDEPIETSEIIEWFEEECSAEDFVCLMGYVENSQITSAVTIDWLWKRHKAVCVLSDKGSQYWIVNGIRMVEWDDNLKTLEYETLEEAFANMKAGFVDENEFKEELYCFLMKPLIANYCKGVVALFENCKNKYVVFDHKFLV